MKYHSRQRYIREGKNLITDFLRLHMYIISLLRGNNRIKEELLLWRDGTYVCHDNSMLCDIAFVCAVLFNIKRSAQYAHRFVLYSAKTHSNCTSTHNKRKQENKNICKKLHKKWLSEWLSEWVRKGWYSYWKGTVGKSTALKTTGAGSCVCVLCTTSPNIPLFSRSFLQGVLFPSRRLSVEIRTK
jgi:hypothetical protein